MKEIYKSKNLENVKYAIRGRTMEEACKLENKGVDILKLNIGNPAEFGLKVPKKIRKCMKKNIKNAGGYSNSKGIEKARIAIKKYYEGKNVKELNINDIYLGNGVSELILMSMQALLSKDDEVLIPMPDYPLWTASVNLAGGKAVHYVCDEENEWYPNIKDMENKITNKTKAIVIINPNNPTGSLYPKEILEQIMDLARRYNLIIFSDEIYDRLVYDDLEHISIASLSKDVPIITFSGLSKSHMAAGFRIGWMLISGNKENIKDYIQGLNLLSSMRLCSNVPAQYIVEKALKDTKSTQKLFKKGGRLYKQREYIYNELNSIPGITVIKPKATFYIFPKIDTKKFNITDDEKFALDFLKEKHILFIHGSGFNYNNVDHFRITYLANKKQLKHTIKQLKDFLKTYKQ